MHTIQVKTGKNKGYYVVLSKSEKFPDSLQSPSWGILPYEYNYTFYKRHSIDPVFQVVLTHTKFSNKNFWANQLNLIQE